MPRVGLTPEAVVEVALGIVDEKGVEGLSLAAVADRAGVAAPSLYKHVGSLGALRDLMGVRVLRQVTAIFAESIMGRSRDEAVEALMRGYRGWVLANPGRYRLVPLDPLHDPAMTEAARELLDVFAAVLRGYGLAGEAATHAVRRLRATVHGFVDLEIGGGFGMPEDIEASYDEVVRMMLGSLR